MKRSRCLNFWSTPEITLIVATRGAISLNLPDRNIKFLVCCVAMDTIVPLNSTQGDQKRQRKGNGKGQKVQNKEEASLATLLAKKQVLKNGLEIRELQTCVFRVFILPKDSDVAASTSRPTKSLDSKDEQQNTVPLSVEAWIGLVRTTMSAPTLPGTSRQHQHELARIRDSTKQGFRTLGLRIETQSLNNRFFRSLLSQLTTCAGFFFFQKKLRPCTLSVWTQRANTKKQFFHADAKAQCQGQCQ